MADKITLTIDVDRSCFTVVEAPKMVTQRNAERVLGIGKRQFLDLLPDYRADGHDVTISGKLRLVDADTFVAWLKNRSAPVVATPTKPANDAHAAAAKRLGLRVLPRTG